MKPVANLCSSRFSDAHGNWAIMYQHVCNALNELGYTVRKSEFLEFPTAPDFVENGIIDREEDIYFYNHRTKKEQKDSGLFQGAQSFFLKPTAPTHLHFTIDRWGYGPFSEITYKRPNLEIVKGCKEFYESSVATWIEAKANKWADRKDLAMQDLPVKVPENHILFIGQMPGDTTVNSMSFGNHWEKFCALVDEAKKGDLPIVVKVHPTLRSEILVGETPEDWAYYDRTLLRWEEEDNITVFSGRQSLHNILPHTRVAVVENSTSGIECLMHNVPIISYGYPEYHWVTYDLRHLPQISYAAEDLSWHNLELCQKWLTWFCRDFQCYDHESTVRRLHTLLA